MYHKIHIIIDLKLYKKSYCNMDSYSEVKQFPDNLLGIQETTYPCQCQCGAPDLKSVYTIIRYIFEDPVIILQANI